MRFAENNIFEIEAIVLTIFADPSREAMKYTILSLSFFCRTTPIFILKEGATMLGSVDVTYSVIYSLLPRSMRSPDESDIHCWCSLLSYSHK